MTKVDLVIVKWMNKFFPSVGSMGCHRFGAYSGRAVHMKQDTPFLSTNAIPDGVCVCFGVCVYAVYAQ